MIWVITDHHDTRVVLVPLIVKVGYRVTEIDCGEHVVKRIQFQWPRLFIIDCALPDGFELIAKIRADHRARSIPIVMFSTGSENFKDKALLLGADAYVPKGSLDWAELLAEIGRFAGPPPLSNPG